MLSLMATNEHSGKLISMLLERQREIAPEQVEDNPWWEDRIGQILKKEVGVPQDNTQRQGSVNQTTKFYSPDGSSYTLTPLEYAINVGSGLGIIEELLRGGCDPCYTESTVELSGSPCLLTPLVRAVMVGRTDLVKLLVKHGAQWPDPATTQRMHQMLQVALEEAGGTTDNSDKKPSPSLQVALDKAENSDAGENAPRSSKHVGGSSSSSSSSSRPITTLTDELALSELLPESHSFLEEFEGILRLDDARGPGCGFGHLNMIFYGNDGLGKVETAKHIAKLCYEYSKVESPSKVTVLHSEYLMHLYSKVCEALPQPLSPPPSPPSIAALHRRPPASPSSFILLTLYTLDRM
jgi:hypothetical protein